MILAQWLLTIFCALVAVGGGFVLIPVARMVTAERAGAGSLGRLLIINGGLQ